MHKRNSIILLTLLTPYEELNENKIKNGIQKNFNQSNNMLTNQEQRILTCFVKKPLRRIEIARKVGITSGTIGTSLKKT